MLKSAVWLTTAALVWLSTNQAIARRRSLAFLQRPVSLQQTAADPEVAIMLPMLMEQSRCVETLRYFSDLFGSANFVKSVVVCASETEAALRSEAERIWPEVQTSASSGSVSDGTLVSKYGMYYSLDELRAARRGSGGDRPNFSTTADIAAREAKRLNALLGRELFHVAVDSSDPTSRASQINCGLRSLNTTLNPCDSGFLVGIYDADSRPSFSTLEDLAHCASSSGVAFQQPTLYLGRLERFSRGTADAVMFADALMQTHWCLGYEIDNWRRASRLAESPHWWRRRASYATGHGEWIRSGLLMEMGGIPESARTDGMYLGYQLSVAGISLNPTRSVDLAEVPDYPGQIVRQHRHWFAGALSVLQLLKRSEGADAPIAHRLVIVTREMWINARWLLGPVAVLSLFSTALVSGNWVALSVLLAASVVHSVVPGLAVLHRWDDLETIAGRQIPRPAFSNARLVVGLGLRAVLRSVGPALFLWDGLRGRSSHRKVAR